MAFDITIKPLVLFDLEDKIKLLEYEAEGKGKRLYQTFINGIRDLQQSVDFDAPDVYENVKKYVSKDALCSLFYTISGNTILVIGLL